MELGLNVDIVPQDPYRWDALADGSIDLVMSGQAFEHIEWPWLTIQEIARVLRSGGLPSIIAPVARRVRKEPVAKSNPLLRMEQVLVTPHALCWPNECLAGITESAIRSIVRRFGRAARKHN